MVRAVLVLLLLLCTAMPAAAQPGRAYAGGGLASTWQGGPAGSGRYSVAPIGTTRGWTITAGGFVSESLSVEADVMTTGTLQSDWHYFSGDFLDVVEERRGFWAGGNLRYHPLRRRPVGIELLGGASIVKWRAQSIDTWTRFASGSASSTTTTTVPFQVDPSLALRGGVDVRIGRRVAVVPGVRLMGLLNGSGYATTSALTWATSMTLAGRVSF